MAQNLEHTLERLYRQLVSLTQQVEELRSVVNEAEHDSPTARCVALRKVLQEILCDVHFRRFGRRPGTSDTLQELQSRLIKEGCFPEDYRTKANLVRELGNDGAHMTKPRMKDDVVLSLGALLPILNWYFRQHRPEIAINEEAAASPHVEEHASPAASPAESLRPAEARRWRSWAAVGVVLLITLVAGAVLRLGNANQPATRIEMIKFQTRTVKALASAGDLESVQLALAEWQQRAYRLPESNLRAPLLAEIEAMRESSRLNTLASVHEHLRSVQILLEGSDVH
jgi:hypothetical protein